MDSWYAWKHISPENTFIWHFILPPIFFYQLMFWLAGVVGRFKQFPIPKSNFGSSFKCIIPNILFIIWPWQVLVQPDIAKWYSLVITDWLRKTEPSCLYYLFQSLTTTFSPLIFWDFSQNIFFFKFLCNACEFVLSDHHLSKNQPIQNVHFWKMHFMDVYIHAQVKSYLCI